MRGFDWGSGCASGSGCFTMKLDQAGQLVDVGRIPAGKWSVEVFLEASADLDIQLYDLGDTTQYKEGKAIVSWCNRTADPQCNLGDLGNNAGQHAVVYTNQPTGATMTIEYSGYNGDGAVGNEYIKISGESVTPMMMKVFAFKTGEAKVDYKWSFARNDCCLGLGVCGGSFKTPVAYKVVLDVGAIPAGKIDVSVTLEGQGDIDIQLYDREDTSFLEGAAIVAWCHRSAEPGCNLGPLHGAIAESVDYQDLTYFYSGYNGLDGDAGKESISITGTSNRELMMRVFGYTEGEALVTYTYWNPRVKDN